METGFGDRVWVTDPTPTLALSLALALPLALAPSLLQCRLVVGEKLLKGRLVYVLNSARSEG